MYALLAACGPETFRERFGWPALQHLAHSLFPEHRFTKLEYCPTLRDDKTHRIAVFNSYVNRFRPCRPGARGHDIAVDILCCTRDLHWFSASTGA